ncbi:hypothetical protein FRB95_009766 [Tulasnella sp. JGI-2019a]|nr:hypothetical protein FRB95_009766 [Tulasnella sp. JGI-2019a]
MNPGVVLVPVVTDRTLPRVLVDLKGLNAKAKFFVITRIIDTDYHHHYPHNTQSVVFFQLCRPAVAKGGGIRRHDNNSARPSPFIRNSMHSSFPIYLLCLLQLLSVVWSAPLLPAGTVPHTHILDRRDILAPVSRFKPKGSSTRKVAARGDTDASDASEQTVVTKPKEDSTIAGTTSQTRVPYRNRYPRLPQNRPDAKTGAQEITSPPSPETNLGGRNIVISTIPSSISTTTDEPTQPWSTHASCESPNSLYP